MRLISALLLVLSACSVIGPTCSSARGAHVGIRAIAIGDSVMLGAQSQLQRRGIVAYAAQDRAFIAGIDLAQTIRASRGFPRNVVIHLGTNGPVSDDLFAEMMDTLKGVPQVYFLTVKEPRWWETEVNDALRRGVHKFKRAHLIDWRAAAMSHPSWLASDGIHLTPAGTVGYASLVARALR